MKIAVLGGGGVRSLFLAKSLMNKAGKLGIDEIVFMDNDERKLRIYAGLSMKAAKIIDPHVKFEITTDPVEAIRNADYIITTLRVGQDEARILDEKIALKYGVLGQETTGAGGFAMALRSIPVLAEYCTMVKKYARPGALLFNFTNPSGLVTQYLRQEGFDFAYGICDSPSGFKKELAKVLGADHNRVSMKCFGLNHLSWFSSVKVDGKEKIEELIENPLVFQKTEEHLFEPELVKSMGMLLNGYLYFYYYREQAVENILRSGKTRGETILEVNRAMYDALSSIDMDADFDKALAIYTRYHDIRAKSYMSIESKGSNSESSPQIPPINLMEDDDGGYAGVALSFIEAVQTGREVEMVLIVPNHGAIDGLKDDDTVEVTCRVDAKGAAPVRIGSVPDIQMSLIRQVKLFENLAVEAIRDKSREKAVQALMVHPLVNSYSLAKSLVDEYLEAHKKYTGEWR